MQRLQGLPQKSIVSSRFIMHIVYMSLCYRTVTGTTNHWKRQQAYSGIVSGRQGLGQARALARRHHKKQARPGSFPIPGRACLLILNPDDFLLFYRFSRLRSSRANAASKRARSAEARYSITGLSSPVLALSPATETGASLWFSKRTSLISPGRISPTAQG